MSIVEMRVPTIGESITEVTLSQWLKADGEYVNLDEPICEFESDKATLEFPAEAAGKIVHVAAEGDDLEIGALVAKIDTSVSRPVETTEAPSPNKVEATASKSDSSSPSSPSIGAKDESNSNTYASGHPSPSAAKILAEKGISPQTIIGSGKDGRITKEDALKAEAPAPNNEMEAKTSSMVGGLFSRQTTKKKMSRMRRTIADRLVRAKNQTAMLTTFNEVDLTEVMALRKKYQEEFVEKYGIKLGFMSLFSKACAHVLMDMPDVNAQIIDNELVYHDYVDISIAISTPTGLVVPPVKNVESLHFADIEKEIKHLSNKARNGTLTIEEMQGGTFTITNGGVFGSLLSTPILNEPQSAILGMHSIKERPVAINGKVEIRPMMYLALSYDHRVIDGSSSVTFLVRVKELLEDPAKMLLGI
ncbi:MAG: 2-oxoglutarate dehydrogenase complex dihydrolipoyllysine-residue succinyltransferase [Saprospiraceae bacterium]|jgi:2-oxoglutarate dehydrogenase E2 component (dihydrolipoamide succinyltransferase)